MRLLSFLIASCLLAPLSAQDPPNIVLILVDDLGFGDLSGQGATDLHTPRLDALMRSGMRFTQAYANCPVCSPTRAALLSGRYPETVGVPGVIRETTPENNWGYLDPETTLLPARLKTAGYQTAIIGKWHLGSTPENHPLEHGFDVFHGMLEGMVHDYVRFTMYGASERVDLWSGREASQPTGEHATDLWTRRAIEWLEERDRGRPFFLYLAYNAPHTPIQPPEEFLRRVRAERKELTERRARLVALIEHLDARIGRVLDALDRLELRENTLVIFTSDNGGQSDVGANNGPYRGGKQQMYEGGLRVPWFVSWPGRVEADSQTEQVAISMDLFATCCAAAGVEPGAVDGVNLLPTMLGEDRIVERDLFWTRREGGTRYMGQTVWAVRSGDWKLLQDGVEGPFELYDLANDPRETNDLRAREPERFRDLAARLRRHLQRGGRQPWLRR